MSCTSYHRNPSSWGMLLQREETLLTWTTAIKSAKHSAPATIWPRGLCLTVTILNSHALTNSWYFPAPSPKPWAHSFFANKMGGIKIKKKRDREEIFHCSLHQLCWSIKAASLLSQVQVFLKIPGDIWSSRIKAGVNNVIHPTHMKARQICLGAGRRLDTGEQTTPNETTAPFNS